MTSSDKQLLFGVLALQLELITVEQFVEVCTIWASKKDRALPDLLYDRGYLQAQDKSDIDRLMTRKVAKHGGDVAASLREAGNDTRVRQSLLSISDAEIHKTLAPTPPPHGLAIVATRAFTPESHERFTLSRLHREGGIGRVWLAHDVALRREVALKELRPERVSNELVIGRFLREARITGQLEHPCIVPIYEVGNRPDDNAPYYTMRFIRGQTMAEAAAEFHGHRAAGKAGPLELRKLMTAFIGVCNAIAYAHSRGVLHRDLKPQNIVLGGFGEVIVLDWGLAKVTDEPEPGPVPLDLGSEDGLDETRPGQALGTPSYMSPEQAEGRHDLMNTRTDVYGLGAVLYHLLTNKPPFPAKSADEAIRMVVEEPVKPVRELVPDVSPALEAVCLKALSKKQSDRYESATALADEVQHWLADEPVKAYKEPPYIRASRWAKRHRTVVAASAVFLVCSAVALAAASAMTYREQQRTERSLARTLGLIEDVMKTADAELGQPGLDTMPARRRLIERLVSEMASIQEERGNDPKVMQSLAALRQYQGTVLRLDGKNPAAEESIRKSIAELESLLKAHPEDDGHTTMLAAANYQLSEVQMRAGRRKEAADSAQRAVKYSEAPAAKGNVVAIANLGIAHNQLSVVQYGWQPMKTTEASALKAADLLREAITKLPVNQSISTRQFLSGALVRIASCRREDGRAQDALPLCDESSKLLQEAIIMKATHPDQAYYRALTLLIQGRTLAAIPGRENEALPAFKDAIALWKTVPGAVGLDRYGTLIAQSYARSAEVLRRTNRAKDAAKEITEAERVLGVLSPGGRVTIDYYRTRGIVSAEQVRLAVANKDSESAKKHMDAARASYNKLLDLDPDDNLDRREFTALEANFIAAMK